MHDWRVSSAHEYFSSSSIIFICESAIARLRTTRNRSDDKFFFVPLFFVFRGGGGGTRALAQYGVTRCTSLNLMQGLKNARRRARKRTIKKMDIALAIFVSTNNLKLDRFIRMDKISDRYLHVGHEYILYIDICNRYIEIHHTYRWNLLINFFKQ